LVTHSYLLTALIKLPPIICDLGIMIAMYWLIRGLASVRWALLGVASFAFSPYILSIGATWGQQDADYVFVALLAIVLAIRQRPVWAGVLSGAAIMLKPMPIFLVPLILVYIWRSGGVRAALRYGGSFSASALVISFPYLLPPRPEILAFLHNVRDVE